MKFAFIDVEKANHTVTALFKVLGVRPKGYHAWRVRGQCQRKLDDQALLVLIKESFSLSRQTYGSPRIYRDLKAKGYRVSEKRIASIMQENG